MTQDFRHVRLPQDDRPSAVSPDKMPATTGGQSRQWVLMGLYASALAFVLLAVWILAGDPGWVAPEVRPVLGVALLGVAFSDVVAVQLLKRLWRNSRPG